VLFRPLAGAQGVGPSIRCACALFHNCCGARVHPLASTILLPSCAVFACMYVCSTTARQSLCYDKLRLEAQVACTWVCSGSAQLPPHVPPRYFFCTQGALEARLKAAADEHTTLSQRERDMFTEDLGPVFGSGRHVRLCRVVVGGTVEGEERLHISATVWILAVWRYGVHVHGTCCP
jgi:hypothetical protein